MLFLQNRTEEICFSSHLWRFFCKVFENSWEIVKISYGNGWNTFYDSKIFMGENVPIINIPIKKILSILNHLLWPKTLIDEREQSTVFRAFYERKPPFSRIYFTRIPFIITSAFDYTYLYNSCAEFFYLENERSKRKLSMLCSRRSRFLQWSRKFYGVADSNLF